MGVKVGDALVFDLTAADGTDPNPLHTLTWTAVGLPDNAVFVDNDDNTGTCTFSPDSSQVGSVSILFIATDQGTPQLSSNINVTINVVMENRAPEIDYILPQTVAEGGTLVVDVAATDPDGGFPVLSIDNLPTNGSFVDNLDGTGQFTFTPSYIQSGLYGITVRAFDGIDVDKQNVLIQVYEAGNQTPIIDPLPVQSVTEGDTMVVDITAFDPDGNIPTLTVDSLPVNATFTDNGDGTGVIDFIPEYWQSGSYDVYIMADDGELIDTLIVVLDITEAGNQTPVLVPLGDQVVDEMQTLTFTLIAGDADLDTVVFSYDVLPGDATFTDNNDNTGTFEWDTDNLDAGDYTVNFTVTDPGGAFDGIAVNITVNNVNLAPQYALSPSPVELFEMDTIVYNVYARDQDGTLPIIEFDTANYVLAANMTFETENSGDTMSIGHLTFMPDYTQGSPSPGTIYYVRWKVIDEEDEMVSAFTNPATQLKVYDKNMPPIIQSLNDTIISEGEHLLLVVNIDDIDATPCEFQYSALPAGAIFTDYGNNIGVLDWTPGYLQNGIYPLEIYAVDNAVFPAVADTAAFVITVTEAGNQAPVFITTEITDTVPVIINRDTTLNYGWEDPELTAMTITAAPVPANGSFADNGDGTASFSYSPNAGDLGLNFSVELIATDGEGAADTVVTYIRIIEFVRGDANSDNYLDISDIMFLFNYLYRDGTTPALMDAADVNYDAEINLEDPLHLLRYFFRQGPPPPQ